MRTWMFALSLIFIPLGVFAADPTLLGVKADRNQDRFFVELNFDQDVSRDNITVDFINETVQLNIAGAKFPEKKSLIRLKDDQVKSLYVYKPNSDLLRSRLIYKKGNSVDQFKDSVKISVNEKQVRFEVLDQPKAEPLLQPVVLSPDSEKAAVSTHEISTSEIQVAAEKVRNELPAKIENEPKRVIAAPEVEKTGTKKEAEKAESDIPVLGGAKSKVISEAPGTGRLIASLGVLLALLIGGSILVRKWYQGRLSQRPNQAIRVISQHHLGPKKSLAVIRVAGETLLVGVTDNNVNLIKTLSLIDDEIPEDTPRNFYKTLTKAATKKMDDEELEEPDEFAFRGIRDMVKTRIKSLNREA